MRKILEAIVAFQHIRLNPSLERLVDEVAQGVAEADDIIQDYIDDCSLESHYSEEGDNYFALSGETKRVPHAFFAAVRAASLLRREWEPPFGFEDLSDINNELFGDLYPAAGELRREDEGVFCSTALLVPGIEELFDTLQRAVYYKRDFVPGKGAELLTLLSLLHPFKYGNGESILLFFFILSGWAGWGIDENRIDVYRFSSALSHADKEALESMLSLAAV